jgi:hypothetical protein
MRKQNVLMIMTFLSQQQPLCGSFRIQNQIRGEDLWEAPKHLTDGGRIRLDKTRPSLLHEQEGRPLCRSIADFCEWLAILL